MQVERDKVKHFILALFQVSGEELLDKAQLGKAYCYANIEALKSMRRPLCLWPVVKMPHGPGIEQYREIVDEMVADGWLKSVGTYMFKRGSRAPAELALRDEEIESVRAGWEHIMDRDFSQLRRDSHSLASYDQAEFGCPMLLEIDAFAGDSTEAPSGSTISNEKWNRWKNKGLSQA